MAVADEPLSHEARQRLTEWLQTPAGLAAASLKRIYFLLRVADPQRVQKLDCGTVSARSPLLFLNRRQRSFKRPIRNLNGLGVRIFNSVHCQSCQI
jgi:hypothetical protein